jgi:hypothetical protein
MKQIMKLLLDVNALPMTSGMREGATSTRRILLTTVPPCNAQQRGLLTALLLHTGGAREALGVTQASGSRGAAGYMRGTRSAGIGMHAAAADRG